MDDDGYDEFGPEVSTYSTGGWGGGGELAHRHTDEEDEYARNCPLTCH